MPYFLESAEHRNVSRFSLTPVSHSLYLTNVGTKSAVKMWGLGNCLSIPQTS